MGELVTSLLLIGGAAFMLLASIGILRMPDLFMRMQTATKAATLGVGFLLLAVAVHFGDTGTTSRVLLIVAFVFLTAPVAAHAIARAAYCAGTRLWSRSLVDELGGIDFRKGGKMADRYEGTVVWAVQQENPPWEAMPQAEAVARAIASQLGRPMKRIEAASAKAVATLCRQAEADPASVVVVATGRRGWRNWFRRSLAERLLMECPRPLVVVGPGTRPWSRCDSLLLATDFKEFSEEAFEASLALAATLGVPVTLYSKLDYMVGGAAEPYRQQRAFIEKRKRDVAERRARGEAWAARARARGVGCDVVIDEGDGVVPEAIARRARDQGDCLVILLSRTGPWQSVFSGGVSRPVLRDCPRPVLLFRPGRSLVAGGPKPIRKAG